MGKKKEFFRHFCLWVWNVAKNVLYCVKCLTKNGMKPDEKSVPRADFGFVAGLRRISDMEKHEDGRRKNRNRF